MEGSSSPTHQLASFDFWREHVIRELMTTRDSIASQHSHSHTPLLLSHHHIAQDEIKQDKCSVHLVMSAQQHAHESRKRRRLPDGEDFEELARSYPAFARELQATRAKQKQQGGSFSSVVTQEFNISLTRALIHSKFGLVLPSLPLDRLCPPVPNRFFYVEWLQQDLLPLLSETNHYFDTIEPLVHRGLDIGSGASCIYPLLFAITDKEYSMIATEIDAVSIESARANVNANNLQDRIRIQLVNPTHAQQRQESNDSDTGSSGGPIARAFESCQDSSISFDFCMTNPPFFDTAISTLDCRADSRDRTAMTEYEGAYPGGEVGFVCDMIRDSIVLRDQGVGWYSTMCGKKTSFIRLKQILTHLLGPGHIQSMEFSPGYMTRWFLAWTFRRPTITSPSARVRGGSFEVCLDSNCDEKDALDEVATRITVYCESLPGWNLSTTVNTTESGKVVTIVEASLQPTPTTWSVEGNNETMPERLFDSITRDWDANRFLPKEGHFLVEAAIVLNESQQADRDKSNTSISVSLDCYRHSSRGNKAVEKIRSQLQGEICRTNRRWRRILRRQADKGRVTNN